MEEKSATTPPVAVELAELGSQSVLRFRVRSSFSIARLGVGARFVEGSGSVQIDVPTVATQGEAGVPGAPDGGVSSSFVVADTEAHDQAVCAGTCPSEVEVTFTRTAGSDPASLETWFTATTDAYDSCEDEDHTLIVERVE